jgi:transposase
MAAPALSTRRLDHLGLVAGMCRKLELAQRIDALLPAEGRKVSHGEAIVAMVLNALGFVSRPLYLFPEFLANKPVDLLIRSELEPSDFNDDCLGRTMDASYDFGVTELFAAVAGPVLQDCGIPTDIGYLDTTSFSFSGQYKPQELEATETVEGEAADDRHPIHITYGFSKDQRQDLKQAVLSLICTHHSTLPMWMEALDGNSSDKKSFPSSISAFCSQLKGANAPLFVVDSAFYTVANLQNIGDVRFVTRVPHTLKAVGELLSVDFEEGDWHEGPNEQHCYRVVHSEYAGVPQRWVIVYSKQRDQQDRDALDRKIAQAKERADKDANKLSGRRFDCQPDAHKAVEAMAEGWRFHKAVATYTEHKQYKGRGRPKKDAAPEQITWQAHVEVVEDEDASAQAHRGDGMYVIATHELDEGRMSTVRLIELYKEQGVTVERGFRFLKDPLFFASAVYLHKPQRIMALMMIMTLSLLVYTLTERQLREELAKQEVTVPDQKGKPTRTPTLRRIFQLFEGLDLLVVEAGSEVSYQVLNLYELHRKILKLFPPEVENLYLQPARCGR